MAKTTEIIASTREVIVTDGDGRWTMTPEQAEKHLPTFAAHAQKLSAGDVSAIRDAAADAKNAAAQDAKNK